MRLAGDFSCAYRELMLKSEIAMDDSITTLELLNFLNIAQETA